jgi:hypothetical protein
MKDGTTDRMSRGLNRRRVLAGAAALGGVTAIAGLSATDVLAKDDKQHAELVGTWLITVTPDDPKGSQFKVLTSFAEGGVSMAATANDLAAGTRGTPGFGAWVRTGRNTFRLLGQGFPADDNGNNIGMAFVRENATIDSSGTYHGVATLEVVGKNGQVLFSATSTALGKRIVA